MILDFNELIKRYNINIKGIIHIGAFHGEEKIIYNNLGVNNVIWIEANPNYEEIIRNNVGDDIIIISGVGNETSLTQFNIANNGQSSSFLELGTHLDEHPNIYYSEKIDVEIKKMSDIVNEYNIDLNQYNVISIDTQGFELEVMKGFDKLINKIDCIYTEINEKELYKGCPLVSDIDSYLNTYGFIRVSTNITEHGWGDAFYIKEKK